MKNNLTEYLQRDIEIKTETIRAFKHWKKLNEYQRGFIASMELELSILKERLDTILKTRRGAKKGI